MTRMRWVLLALGIVFVAVIAVALVMREDNCLPGDRYVPESNTCIGVAP